MVTSPLLTITKQITLIAIPCTLPPTSTVFVFCSSHPTALLWEVGGKGAFLASKFPRTNHLLGKAFRVSLPCTSSSLARPSRQNGVIISRRQLWTCFSFSGMYILAEWLTRSTITMFSDAHQTPLTARSRDRFHTKVQEPRMRRFTILPLTVTVKRAGQSHPVRIRTHHTYSNDGIDEAVGDHKALTQAILLVSE
ncbi:hypothetical protein B0H34DRAFT_86766 [Crassisporium funariophilum]|nr:hypothetical protein B0H34DRAFT_86766 [Crassisporium funariophilum]